MNNIYPQLFEVSQLCQTCFLFRCPGTNLEIALLVAPLTTSFAS